MFYIYASHVETLIEKLSVTKKPAKLVCAILLGIYWRRISVIQTIALAFKFRHTRLEMLRYKVVLLLVCLAVGALSENCEDNTTGQCAPKNNEEKSSKPTTSVYDFHVRDIYGNDVDLGKYRGHVSIIVNVASNCGLTDTNYRQLVQLYEKYGQSKGLRILAFPSNQFGGQEPGTSQEILDFVKRYNVTFDLFEKVDVNGENAHPLWKYLTGLDGPIRWNFTKFIVDKEGNVVATYPPSKEPLEMESVLKKYL
ncbi:hypothetical protein KPH14_002202 [Odynerus spinipes]|uniref:Glutathione peroxidase n=1 Tax=Odynerus spinipes TaxID=1348599 RepID=A0AAD9VP10_9HYME|nr:hypothetical protein KPH14_002202 [Odynerus spinipes]